MKSLKMRLLVFVLVLSKTIFVFSAEWSNWTTWSNCTRACDGGTQERYRNCSDTNECDGISSTKRTCNTHKCSIGSWSAWSVWSVCSEPCGDGVKTRTRSCIGGRCIPPTPSQENQTCTVRSCTATDWSSWSEWSECSQKCMGGLKIRLRNCHGGKASMCPGFAKMSQACGEGACVGVWALWSAWSECTQPCGSGTQRRERLCSSGLRCRGNAVEDKKCNIQPCGAPDQWAEWGECSVSCGIGGFQKRKKTFCATATEECSSTETQQRGCIPLPAICPLPPLRGLFGGGGGLSQVDGGQILKGLMDLITGLFSNGNLLGNLFGGLLGGGGGGGALAGGGGLPGFGQILGQLGNIFPAFPRAQDSPIRTAQTDSLLDNEPRLRTQRH